MRELLRNQVKMLSYELKNESRGSQNAGFAVLINGKLDIRKLERALDSISDKFDGLKMKLTIREDGMVCQIPDAQKIKWQKHYYSDEREAFAYIEKYNREPMELFDKAMFEFHLCTISSEKHIMYIKANHIVTDGPSFRAIFGELFDIYQEKPGKNVISWDEYVGKKTEAGQDEYWNDFEEYLPEYLTLEDIKGVETTCEKTEDFSMSLLTSTARKYRTSVFNMLLFAYNYSLAKLFHQDTFAVNYTISDRFTKDSMYLVGLTTGNVPYVLKNIKDRRLDELFRESFSEIEENFRHFKSSDILRTNQFTISYLTETVKLPYVEGLDMIVCPIKGPMNYNDATYTLMCIEKEDKTLGISALFDERYFTAEFTETVKKKMLETIVDLKGFIE